MSDLIDRQAAIDALGGNEPVGDPSKMDDDDVVKMWERIRIINIINKLPSAQPETHEKRTETHACDLISRQAAIDALDKRFDKIPMEQTTEILKLRKDLRGLPSIQSEQKRGRWIYGEDEYGIDGYHCDKCGFFVPWDYTHKFINYIEDYNFCPSCGADMRGEQDE